MKSNHSLADRRVTTTPCAFAVYVHHPQLDLWGPPFYDVAD